MNVDHEISVAMLLIEADIASRIYWGNAEINRTIAESRAWIRYWPDAAPNHRSEGQFLRHIRIRNASSINKLRAVQLHGPVS